MSTELVFDCTWNTTTNEVTRFKVFTPDRHAGWIDMFESYDGMECRYIAILPQDGVVVAQTKTEGAALKALLSAQVA